MSNQVVTKIQFRRGPESERLAIENLGPGEPIFSTDPTGSGKFFIGDGSTPGGLSIKDLCYNPTAPSVVSVAEGDLIFKNGILENFTERVDDTEGFGGSIGNVVGNSNTSNSNQYIQEIFTNVSSRFQSDASVLVRAIRYVNGVVTGISNGPGQLFQYRTSQENGRFMLTNDSSYTGKQDNKSSTWSISFVDGTNDIKKEKMWFWLDLIQSSTNQTHMFNTWVYTTPSGFTKPQQICNDGLWFYVNNLAGGTDNGQWIFTGMSLYPYIFVHPSGGRDILGEGTGQWSYISNDDNGDYFLYNFVDGRWHNSDGSVSGIGAATTPTQVNNRFNPLTFALLDNIPTNVPTS